MSHLKTKATKGLGWVVHLLTASGVLFGLFSIIAIANGAFNLALTIITITIIIDAVDGPLARTLNIKSNIPSFDGTLLDNIVDFITWVLIPCFFLIQTDMLGGRIESFIGASAILLSSSYQFCCTDVKAFSSTFKRWPSAWSIVVILLFVWHMSAVTNAFVIGVFVVLSIIPIYYIHPFQKNRILKNTFIVQSLKLATIAFIGSMLWSIKVYPVEIRSLTIMQQIALIGYFAISLYQTGLLIRKSRP